jgi:predicted adenine nucleotide alpha hydrolase (AANH) superfamily ATPase
MPEQDKIVLMSCCAPCSCGAIAEMKEQGANFIVLFYNPNIFPDTEYQKRLDEQIKYCEKLGVKYHIGDYNHDEWLNCVCGMESEPERGKRCTECFKMRFAWGARWARDNGYNKVMSVFGVSKHKDQAQVDAAAKINQSIEYVPIEWSEQLRQKISKESDFYRQNYCGCEFSQRKTS